MKPHPPRELAVVCAITAVLVAASVFVPRGGDGTLLKALGPTLTVLAWVAPAYLAIERRKKDPLQVLGLSTRPRDPVAWLVALAMLPLYAIGFIFMKPGFHRPELHPWSFVDQLLFAALPEETFFRGSLQPSLPFKKAPQRIAITSLVFALAHLATDPHNPARLLVFFPSLVFGWLRERTGSVVPGLIFHALCNVLEEHVRRGYL